MGVAAAVLLTLAAPAFANDSTAELRTGGLDFVYNPDVEMRSETLFVSTAQIRVAYRFVNNSDRPVTNLVAFPMPDITVDNPDWNVAVPAEDPVNFLGFTTTANGEAVRTEVEQKVFAQGIERTALLQQLGIPIAPQLKATGDALDALPRDKWQGLIDLGLADIEEYGTTADGVLQKHLAPRWTLKTTYFWRQTFPPHQELAIEHRYTPSVGSSAGSIVGGEYPADLKPYTATYCMDPGFVAAATRLQQAARARRNAYVSERRVDYILQTGANWAGPIADFTLTVDKGKPDNLVSFCANGVTKISPTQFRVHYSDFTPTADLAVLILTTNVAQ